MGMTKIITEYRRGCGWGKYGENGKTVVMTMGIKWWRWYKIFYLSSSKTP